jgi:hypothetical protein
MLINGRNQVMSAIITISLLSLSSFILGTVLFFLNSSSNNNNVIYAQFQNNNSNALLGVNITSPEKGQQIPVGNNLTVSGKSTDEPTSDDCQVSVIVNSIKPYQPATANGTIEGGKNDDYSKWFFVLSSNYTSIKEGVNEITAKLSCLSSISNNNTTKWYSINVTGIPTAINNNITFPPQSSSVISPSNQDKSNNNSDPQSSETNMNELQEPIFDINNDDNNDEIHEEVKKLRDKIIEGVKETLERQGIEWNVPSSLK